jgi:beta-glucosidase
MVDIARDPRWGRIAEGNGEDAYLGSQIAKAMVKGYQGDLSKNNNIMACVKHMHCMALLKLVVIIIQQI